MAIAPMALVVRPDPRLYSVSPIPTMAYLPLSLVSTFSPSPRPLRLATGRHQPIIGAGKANNIMGHGSLFDNRAGGDGTR
jgi:hypothetical protein